MFGMIVLSQEVTQMSSFSYFVGQRIKKYRKSRGYTIEQFSAMINKSKATLSKYENGAITIDIETLYDIAQALDIDLKCFIDYQPPVFHQDAALPKNNYFNQSLAYMYYYDGRVRQMVRSLLRFSRAADREGIEVTLYLGVTSFSDPDRCQHLFTGEMKAYDTITHMVLTNQINEAEKMYICMLNPMSNRTPAIGLLSGIGSTPFFAPIALKALISIGTIGLIKAINTFRTDKNIKLATYASRCIENEILMYLRKNNGSRVEVSFDEPLSTDWDGKELLLSDVLGTDSDVVMRPIEADVDRQMLADAVAKLNPRERDIITMRFGLGGSKELTQKEVADRLGISQSYISRLEKRIILRLRREILRMS